MIIISIWLWLIISMIMNMSGFIIGVKGMRQLILNILIISPILSWYILYNLLFINYNKNEIIYNIKYKFIQLYNYDMKLSLEISIYEIIVIILLTNLSYRINNKCIKYFYQCIIYEYTVRVCNFVSISFIILFFISIFKLQFIVLLCVTIISIMGAHLRCYQYLIKFYYVCFSVILLLFVSVLFGILFVIIIIVFYTLVSIAGSRFVRPNMIIIIRNISSVILVILGISLLVSGHEISLGFFSSLKKDYFPVFITLDTGYILPRSCILCKFLATPEFNQCCFHTQYNLFDLELYIDSRLVKDGIIYNFIIFEIIEVIDNENLVIVAGAFIGSAKLVKINLSVYNQLDKDIKVGSKVYVFTYLIPNKIHKINVSYFSNILNSYLSSREYKRYNNNIINKFIQLGIYHLNNDDNKIEPSNDE